MVGRYLEEGWGGVTKNKIEAVEWYRKAAENGYAVAQNNLGNCLFYGSGCDADEVEAVEWYRKAAEQGHAQAQNNLAVCLDNGSGCAADKAEAFKWYKKAAEQGIKEAQEALVRRRNSGSASTQVAAQSSGCLLPILVTLTVIVLFVIL